MGDYSKFNLVYRLQKWMDSVPGQTFLNYAYSWGASIVIFGTLCKLTHIPGANFWLFLGMGTEVFVFFISAFDRPFDKTAEGREIPTEVTEEYIETGRVTYKGIYAEGPQQPVEGGVAAPSAAAAQPIAFAEGAPAAQQQPAGVAAGPQAVANPELTDEMKEAQGSYVEQLKKLVETLEQVNAQSQRLTKDSEEMENLNRTLTGISRVYEMQLKGASQQIGTIDQINEQSRRMAKQIEQLNAIYTRMIEAMTVNMRATAPAAPTAAAE